MNTATELEEIAKYYGDGWFEIFLKLSPQVTAFPIEEQIKCLKESSIHGMTSFFREDMNYEILRSVIFPSFTQPYKVAGIGCSDGREVYSMLALVFNQKSIPQIHGFDSNPKFIDEAWRGRYPDRNGDTRSRFQTYDVADKIYPHLERDDRGRFPDVLINEDAKEHVKFKVHDILQDPLPQQYDIVFLSNVLPHCTKQGYSQTLVCRGIAYP